MRGFDDHGHTTRLQLRLNDVGYLRGHFLLDLQALGVRFHDPGQLGNTNNLAIRQVPYVRFADDRSHMMFAMAFEGDAPKNNHLVVAIGFRKRPPQDVGGAVSITGKKLLV